MATESETTQTEIKVQPKRMLQKVAGVIGIVSTIIAVVCGVAMAFFIGEESKVFKASLGAITFFFFMVGLVLNTLANTNIPDLKVER